MPTLQSEKELEDYLYSVLGSNGSVNEEFRGVPFRQTNLEGYGIIDLMAISHAPGQSIPDLEINIIELKKNEIDLTAIGQICRYKKGVERAIKNLPDRTVKKFNFIIRGYLIGTEFTSGDVCYVADNLSWLVCIFYKLNISTGISLETDSGDWYSTSENFNSIAGLFKSYVQDFILPEYKQLLKYCEP